MRILGLDLGERRIGVAAADERVPVAVPLDTLTVSGDVIDALVRLVRDQAADEVVVGLPLSMSGALGPQGQQVMVLVEELQSRLPVPVHTWDERLTTAQAVRARPTVKARRAGTDAAAAAILLQAFLDSRRPPAK